ncbi:MAG: SMP-30/gluconolactonase/LRE family protein [Planctomycetales bacterium]|nr:SMP-30/gluconolactonase/LRE family protein [Planctomycetales bacterium]
MRVGRTVLALAMTAAALSFWPASGDAQDDPFPASPFPVGAAAKPETRVAFTEGPAWHPSHNVFFTDIANNRIMRLDRTGALHTYRTPSGRANGLLFDHDLRMIACEGGGEGGNRRLTRTESDGSVTVLTDRFEGKRYNSPNDVAIDADGNLYFTDPRYGPRDDIEQRDADGRDIEGVYRIDAKSGEVTRVITHEVERPNGVAVSKDGRYLFVADNVNDGPNDGVNGARKLWRFSFAADGTLDPESGKILFNWGTDRGPDGMTLGPDGRLFVAAGFNVPNLPAETSDRYKAGIYVIHPDTGKLEAFLPVLADMITNCTIGGPEGKTLYITAGHKLWSVPLK